MSEENKTRGKFEIIVMTKSENFEIHEKELLTKVCEDALVRAGFDRNLKKWELKDSDGKNVPFEETEEKAGVTPGSRYYLTQKIGAGGS